MAVPLCRRGDVRPARSTLSQLHSGPAVQRVEATRSGADRIASPMRPTERNRPKATSNVARSNATGVRQPSLHVCLFVPSPQSFFRVDTPQNAQKHSAYRRFLPRLLAVFPPSEGYVAPRPLQRGDKTPPRWDTSRDTTPGLFLLENQSLFGEDPFATCTIRTPASRAPRPRKARRTAPPVAFSPTAWRLSTTKRPELAERRRVGRARVRGWKIRCAVTACADVCLPLAVSLRPCLAPRIATTRCDGITYGC